MSDTTSNQALGVPAPPDAQAELVNPVTQVWFRAGLLACREYMARFVEAESPAIAMSIRANWWPSLGKDFGPPRQLDFAEVTGGTFDTPDFYIKGAGELTATQEALPIALGFLQQSIERAAPGAAAVSRAPVRDMGEATESGDRVCEWCNQQVPRLHRCPNASAAVSPLALEELPDIEIVASAVHEAWMEQKRAKGITSAPSQQTGEEQLRPYAELSNEVQEYDRATVRAVYAAIARLRGAR